VISLWQPPRSGLISDFTTSLPPLWAFSRASSGTQVQSGVLSTVGTNVARFETSPAGYLGEPQGTNLYFPSVNWVPNATASSSIDGAVQDAATAPDGTTTAEKLIPGSFNGVHQWYRLYTGAINTTYTASVYVKAAGWDYVSFSLENSAFAVTQRALFNLSNGTISSQSANSTGTIQALAGGWYRVSVQNTSLGVAGNYTGTIIPQLTSVFNIVQTGDAVSGTLVWGEQAEANSFPTSYIATTTAAATRAADNLTLDLTQLPNLQTPTGYSCAIEFSLLSNSQSQVVFGMSGSGGFSNTWYFGTDGAGNLAVTTIVATVAQTSAAATLRAAGLTNRLALTVTPAGITFNLNGAGDVTVANAGMPAMTTLAVMRAPWTAANYEAGHATLVTLVPGPQSAAWRAAMAY